jgi:hypothetical protein
MEERKDEVKQFTVVSEWEQASGLFRKNDIRGLFLVYHPVKSTYSLHVILCEFLRQQLMTQQTFYRH